jgi:hypothetical protein
MAAFSILRISPRIADLRCSEPRRRRCSLLKNCDLNARNRPLATVNKSALIGSVESVQAFGSSRLFRLFAESAPPTSGRWRALRQRLLSLMNFAVLASRSGKECRCALSHTLNSSLAQRVARISGCDWDFASRNAGTIFIVCDGSFSHRDAGSICCVVVSAGQGASV